MYTYIYIYIYIKCIKSDFWGWGLFAWPVS